MIQQKNFSTHKCLKFSIHLSHIIHGEWSSGMFWVGLESSRKLSYIIISLQSLTISCNCVSVESLHRLLLWMMRTLPRTATKVSYISPPHLISFLPVFHGKTVAWKWEVRHEELGPLASGKFQGCHSTGLGRSLLSLFDLSSSRDSALCSFFVPITFCLCSVLLAPFPGFSKIETE